MLLTGTFLDWIAIAVVVIAGIVSLFGIIDRERKKRSQEANDADDRLISLLQGTVTSLERQVKELTKQVGDLTGKVTKLQAENQLLRGILQGRDENTLKYQKILNENNTFARQNAANMERLVVSMEEHMGVVQGLLESR